MKRILLSVLAITAAGLQAQTIVSTTPQNKKVVLEEFTGIYCQYCPQGHAIAQGMKNNNPDDVFLINIHQGGFSAPGAGDPDYRTPFGNAIVAQSANGGSYPSGTINRHVFPGIGIAGGTAMSRGEWVNAGNQILNQSSYLNIATEATIDIQTREITVLVEVYYTGNSPEATNKLNVALLQNNTIGKQVNTTGTIAEYNHMHRLIHLITGQWGVDITETSQGSFYTETFTYTIPEHYNNIPALLGDMEIVAFVTETTQEIISGAGALAVPTNFVYENNVALKGINNMIPTCLDKVTPIITVENTGSNLISSIDFEYSVNGGDSNTFTWNGSLEPLKVAQIQLPESIPFTLMNSNVLNVSVSSDENLDDNSFELTFEKTSIEVSNLLTLNINTDQWGYETSWNIKNSEGQIIQSGQGYGNNNTYTININIPENGCYQFNLIDAYGDGAGPVSLVDNKGSQVFSSPSGNYGLGATIYFMVDSALETSEFELSNNVKLYPNPSTGVFFLENHQPNTSLLVIDGLGKTVYSQNNVGQTVDLSNLAKGIYFAKITNENNITTTQRLIIN
jgi:hypothetical protein